MRHCVLYPNVSHNQYFMKYPDNINKVKLSDNADYGNFPLGFIPIEDTSDGGGDYYGLYWEIGKENSEPIICASRHEESLLVPEFANFKSFIEWYEETDGQETPRLDINDTFFFLSLTNKGKVLTKNGKTDEAIEKLEKSVNLFGEYSDSWHWLGENYYTDGQKEKGDIAFVNSIASNYFFGLPTKKSIERFIEMEPSPNLKSNPLVKRRKDLIQAEDFTNPLSINFDNLLDAIQEFESIKDFRTALILKQNFGLLMSFQTNEIASKYNFVFSKWTDNFKKELISIYPERKY
jgi:tetratricopeptide (TPR) repeat protein